MMFIFFQKVLPHHLLSRVAGFLASTRFLLVRWPFIRLFAAYYKVNMSEAERPDTRQYSCFNDFFTRSLKAGARPIAESAWICPADGMVSEAGAINHGSIVQAKNHQYTVGQLLGESAEAEDYTSGSFVTVYLSPRDYHRVHVPGDARLLSYTYIPGQLFSVNKVTTENISHLFARNERLVCHFDSNDGPFCVVMVGAMIVAGIRPIWQEDRFKPGVAVQKKLDTPLEFNKGDELGKFELGSTVILLVPRRIDWTVSVADKVMMGQSLVR